MAQATGARGRVVGDYLVGQQIGSGSFSVVWHCCDPFLISVGEVHRFVAYIAIESFGYLGCCCVLWVGIVNVGVSYFVAVRHARHRIHGTEVAIKEVATSRLNKKLQESLMSEVSILKRINHSNIICLHDIIEVPGKLHLVLEYCRGGDLSMYIQRHGHVPEAIAKNFIQQLAAGLQMLRENNLIHRDLKPQNLLLSTNDESAVLKIADFGFSRSLQRNGMAETLCGSPLYMAPEIMQLQKYDAKADLWSVGAILFQLVTGKTPFTGNNQIQLLQNIVKSTELHFPPVDKDLSSECKDLCQKLLRRNPVERLTFEEFFNHQFLSSRQSDNMLRRSSRSMDGIPSSESSPLRNTEVSSQEDCLPFLLDDDSSGPEGSPSYFKRRSSIKSTSSFSLDTNADRREATSNVLNNMDSTSRYGGARNKLEKPSCIFDIFSDQNLNGTPKVMYQRPTRSRVADLLESIDQDYVLVSGPPLDSFSTLATASRPSNVKNTLDGPPLMSANRNTSPSVPMPIIGAMNNNTYCVGSLESRSSAPGTSQGSMDIGDALEQPSTNSVTRVESLQQFASAIAELVHEKVESCRQLEAFSIQLVILAIWKQALHICHMQAASAMEGSPSQESTRLRRNSSKKHGFPDAEDCLGVFNFQRPENISSQIEREFLKEVEYAEELAKGIEPGNTEMPDAMEMIFQFALALGRNGAVDELMGNVENASLSYSKAVRLLLFFLVEGPSLILIPPFSLTNSDRYRLQSYIDILNNRHGHSRSQG